MKLSAFALDYDGTIAVEGVLDPSVREAIADLRRQGNADAIAQTIRARYETAQDVA